LCRGAGSGGGAAGRRGRGSGGRGSVVDRLFHKIKHKEVEVVIPDIHSSDRNVYIKMDKKLGMIWQQFSGMIQN
jgi:hypothetical protein